MNVDPMTLPRAVKWKASRGGNAGLCEFLSDEAGATLALAFAALFWPRFVESRGCVLLAERYDEANFDEWWRRTNGSCRQIEAALNHLHLWDLFDPAEEGIPDEGLLDLAGILTASWAAALREQFPGRQFSVSVSDGEGDYGPTVSFVSGGA
jgi:hypothetical protein